MKCRGAVVLLFKRLFILAVLWVICFAYEPINLAREIALRQITAELSPEQIIAVGHDRFVLLDQESKEIFLIDQNGIIKRSGGFGQGLESFSEPTDIVVSKLDVLVSDRFNHALVHFDYNLNLIGSKSFSAAVPKPFYTDLIIANPLGEPYILSRLYGELWELNGGIRPTIEFYQYGINSESIIDAASDQSGNIAILSDTDEIILFNRYGRLIKHYKVLVDHPVNIFRVQNEWVVINETAILQFNDDRMSEFIFINDSEIVVDTDTFFNKIIILTNQRILIFE